MQLALFLLLGANLFQGFQCDDKRLWEEVRFATNTCYNSVITISCLTVLLCSKNLVGPKLIQQNN